MINPKADENKAHKSPGVISSCP